MIRFISHKKLVVWQEGLSWYIGKRVQELRCKMNLTQEELAGKADKERGWVSRIERGVTHLGDETILCVAHALGMPGWQLYKEGEELMEKELTSIKEKPKIKSNGR